MPCIERDAEKILSMIEGHLGYFQTLEAKRVTSKMKGINCTEDKFHRKIASSPNI